jgi:hypothetical protein
MESALLELLRKRRSRLMKAYVVHVIWFLSMCVLGAADVGRSGVLMALLFTLVTVPPVLVYTLLVHNTCRAIDPRSRTAGILLIVLFTIFLTPFESGLILPARNLLISRRILRAWDKPKVP